MQSNAQQNDIDQIDEFKLDIHIAKDNINKKILSIGFPLIVCNFLGYIYQLASENAEMISHGADSVGANIAFLPLINIICEKFPLALAYSMSFDLISSRLEQNVERCNMIITSYLQLTLVSAVIVGLVFGAMGSFLSVQIYVPPSYKISFIVYLFFGYLMNSLNSALFYRYLSEERIFLILVRAAIQYLGQLGLEQFLYVINGGTDGNLMTTLSFIIINGLMIVWQFYIATGHSAYGFKLRNVATVSFSQILRVTKESLRFQGKIALNGVLKLIADIAAPFCILLSEQFIEQTFAEKNQIYYAHNDIYTYAYVFQIIRIVPDAFISVFALIGAVCVSQGDYSMEQRANFLIILLSLLFSAILAIVVLFLKDILVNLFYDLGDAEIRKYFEDSNTNYKFVTTVSLVLYCVDILQQAGIMCAIENGNIIELLVMPILKFVVSITSIITIKDKIGDRANYMYSILFSEGCGNIVGVVYLLNSLIHYHLVLKKKNAKSSEKDSEKK